VNWNKENVLAKW